MKAFALFVCVAILVFSGTPVSADYRKVLDAIDAGIAAEPSIGAHDIRMEYYNGHIYLKGEVSSHSAKKTIEEIAFATMGVKGVSNELVVESPKAAMVPFQVPKETFSDHEIVSELMQALRKSPGAEISEADIEVSGGVVTFRGSRRSFREIDRILSIAFMIPGVKAIDSKMTVGGRPYPSFKQG